MSFHRLKMRDAGPSPKQIQAYGIAASMACRELGICGGREVEEYRHRVILEVTGCASIKHLRTEADYEAVMARFWADAGDWQQAAKYGVGNESRTAYVVKVVSLQLMQLKAFDEGQALAYIGGVLDQARVANNVGQAGGSFWLDVRPDQLVLVLRILDTERRRILRRFGDDKTAFSDRVRYAVDGAILTRQEVAADYYASSPFSMALR